jgi:ABC-type phosphate transport system substrate-binding protein
MGKITDDETTINQKLNAREDKALIQPYARETGSGTRSAFENLIKFREFASGTNPSQALETNSNGIMFTGIQASRSSFGYLSLNYLPAINQDKNLNAVVVDDFDPLAQKNFSPRNGRIVLQNFEKYALTRPFIGVFKTTLSNKRISQIAAFLA